MVPIPRFLQENACINRMLNLAGLWEFFAIAYLFRVKISPLFYGYNYSKQLLHFPNYAVPPSGEGKYGQWLNLYISSRSTDRCGGLF